MPHNYANIGLLRFRWKNSIFARHYTKKMKKIILGLLLIQSLLGLSQEPYYTPPVEIPLLLSGSFAELRSNHFHSGIDIKTQGTIGLPILAAADGYISRIVVSPTGFGKALYITHPNGTSTVYAHLNRFSEEVDSHVKQKQYEKKSFRVDMPIPSYLFPVKKGEEIAKSGNSGSSGGPHLHFEIRETKTEEPLNPLQFDFPVVDNIPPKIFSLLVVPLDGERNIAKIESSKRYPLVFYDGKYHLKNNPAVPVSGKVGFAVFTHDYFNDSYNKCGINFLELRVDDEVQFLFQLNRFAFHNSRYINSHIAYDEYKRSKTRFIRTWLEPGNKLPIYNHTGNKGIYEAKSGVTNKVEIEVKDTYGNASTLSFRVKGAEILEDDKKPSSGTIFKMTTNNRFSNDSLKLEIPGEALYNSFFFDYKTETSSEAFYTKYHFIHNKTVPLHSNATIALKTDSLPKHLESKALMVNVDPMTGEYYAVGGTFENGWVSTKTRTLGVHAVTVDTIPPEIIPRSIQNNTLSEANRIRFTIKDDLAGIETIEGKIDGKWVLFEYDPKNSVITYYFDKERMDFNKEHFIELLVSDYRGNTSTYEARFWK